MRKIGFQGLSPMRHSGEYNSQYGSIHICALMCITTLHLEFHNLAAYKNIPFSKYFKDLKLDVDHKLFLLVFEIE